MLFEIQIGIGCVLKTSNVGLIARPCRYGLILRVGGVIDLSAIRAFGGCLGAKRR